jgi:hypothetical protein
MRNAVVRLSFSALFLALSAAAVAAEAPTLEERMSKGEFHAAGLDKLNADELKTLNAWLAAHQATTTVTKVVTPTGKPVFETDIGQRDIIETKIAGTFSGWYGKTRFRLENGQEWTQAESGQFSNGRYDHPSVRIKPMLLGSWLMSIPACGCSVRVERSQ